MMNKERKYNQRVVKFNEIRKYYFINACIHFLLPLILSLPLVLCDSIFSNKFL